MDTSTVVKADDDGFITGASGFLLTYVASCSAIISCIGYGEEFLSNYPFMSMETTRLNNFSGFFVF